MTNQVRSFRQPSGRLSKVVIILLAISLLALPISSSVAASMPSAPQYVEAMAGPNQVAVTWDRPGSDGGESALNYTVRVWTVPPPTTSPMFASCSTTNLGCVIGGLVSSTPYYVDVFASNSAGAGVPSAFKSISPGGAGSPPTNVTATSDSKGLLTVKWTPSASLGAGQFAWYTAEVFTSPEISIGSYSGFCTESSATASSCLIGGLKLGTTYYLQVRTVSSLGSSFPSTPRYKIVLGSVTSPSPKPSPSPSVSRSKLTPPQRVKVVALSKSVRVSWKAPAFTAGAKILGYRAGAFSRTLAIISSCNTSAKILICTILKLKAKQAVYIGVVALYSGVNSPSSKLIAVVPKC